MTAEQKPYLLIITGPNDKLPPSTKFKEVIGYAVDYGNTFRKEADRCARFMNGYLGGMSLDVAGIDSAGLVAAAAIETVYDRNPRIRRKITLVTFGTPFVLNPS